MRVLLPTRRASRRLGATIARVLVPSDVVFLSGELGSGKTFLARAIARSLGVDAAVRVTSPTFSLVQEYPLAKGALLHADLYRLRDLDFESEVGRLGLRERILDGAILIAEWAEGAERALALSPTLVVRLTASGDVRSADFEGDRLEALAPLLAEAAAHEDLLRRARSLSSSES